MTANKVQRLRPKPRRALCPEHQHLTYILHLLLVQVHGREWVSVALDKAHIFISDCGYGITQQVVKKLREEFTLTKEDEPRAAFDPVSHYSYRDSRNGVFFIE